MILKIKCFFAVLSSNLMFRSLFPEKIFFSVTTRLRECHRVNLIMQTTGISQKFTALQSSAHQEKFLNLSVHNLSFLGWNLSF